MITFQSPTTRNATIVIVIAIAHQLQAVKKKLVNAAKISAVVKLLLSKNNIAVFLRLVSS